MHAMPAQLSPARWAVVFASAWLVGWGAVLSYRGTRLVSALTQTVPMTLALGGLAYFLRRYRH